MIAVMVLDNYKMDVHLIDIPRHDGAIEKIKRAAREFKQDIAAGREPKADLGRDSEAIRLMTQHATAGKTFDGSGQNELPVILAQRAALLARIKQDEARCEEIENEVKLLLGDAGVGQQSLGLEDHVQNHRAGRLHGGAEIDPVAENLRSPTRCGTTGWRYGRG